MRKSIFLLMLCMLLATVMTGCRANADQHTGEAEGYGGKLRVAVTMNGDDITSVRVIEHHETEGVGTRAIDTLPAAIEEADNIGVDSVSGATVTSKAIKEAVSQAMGMSGGVHSMIPMDSASAQEAASVQALSGVGMAATGRMGPGKDDKGNQVYSFNVVFAAASFEPDGVIRSIRVDQLEVASPNQGGGTVFSGFPTAAEGEEAFLGEVAAWTTKGTKGDAYMMTSGSWREQMDVYQRAMVGKTVEEVKDWYSSRGKSAEAAEGGAAADASDAAGMTDALSGATMSLQDEHGDILLAIERAWEDARKTAAPGNDGTLVDTNTVTDAADEERNVG